MKNIISINEFFNKIEPGDKVMTPDGSGIVIPNEKEDGKIWVKLDNKSKSNDLTGDENTYQKDEVKRI